MPKTPPPKGPEKGKGNGFEVVSDVEAQAAKDKQKEYEEQQRKREYDQHLEQVMQLKEMCDTPYFRKFWSFLRTQIRINTEAMKKAEKPKDILRHQAIIKVMEKDLIEGFFPRPVEDHNGFCESFPLLSMDCSVRAQFDTKVGVVELKDIAPKK